MMVWQWKLKRGWVAGLLYQGLLINSKAAGGKLLSEPGIYFQLTSAAAACGSASLCGPCTICDYSTVTTSTAA